MRERNEGDEEGSKTAGGKIRVKKEGRLVGGLLLEEGEMICLVGHSGMTARANKYIQAEWILHIKRTT